MSHSPAAPRRILNLATLGDERFILPLSVFGRSLLAHLRNDVQVELLVIDGGISSRGKERLLSCWQDPRLAVRWHAADVEQLPRISRLGRIPALTYARLLIPMLLPADCQSVVVLDADQLILTDLSRLLAEPMGDALLLAPRDPFIPFISSPNGLCESLRRGRPHLDPYFTAALMVINVPAWRKERISEQSLRIVEEYLQKLHTHDQCALNAVVGSRFRELDPRWQVQPRTLSLRPEVTPHLGAAQRALCAADPWVVHFSGRLKPWLYHGSSRFDALFWQYLQQTEFQMAPPRDLRALAYGLYDGSLRRVIYPWEMRITSSLEAAIRGAHTLLGR